MGESVKKPLWKKWWFWVLIIFVIGALSNLTGKNEENIATAPVQNTSENSNTTTKEPTEEEWQASYRQIALSEARTVLELTQKKTISDERIESAVKVIRSQAEKIKGEDQQKFIDLASFVESKDLEKTKELYLSLGGTPIETTQETQDAAQPAQAEK
ncbi:hypothetical protein [Brevibacillus aydinogluensis]|jgi:hypothetical protein|uniref:Uncharacterized protein n=1 Tax=Brevibacillus aydinogluensis TaxID=927786 RepID=A0AA48M9Q6_9BACL|nr:hypothetical protein [Brevibacillus aydinogluensis]CAJ1003857.1 hypothetical protein BSPP4475_16155 [Brevibacillus aydinogluensis]